MIITQNIEIKMSMRSITHYRNHGYIAKINDIVTVETKDLPKSSHIKIDVKCDICGKVKNILYQKYNKNISNGGYYACSSKCSQGKVKQTNNKKFGSDYYVQTNEYKEQYKETVKNKYGVEYHTQSNIVKDKIKKTVKDKYGVDNISKLQTTKNKIKNTVINKYGVDNISKLDSIKQILSKKSIENTEVRLSKSKETLLDKYGVDNISKLDFIKDKKIKTCNKNHGVDNVLLLESNKKKAILSRLNNWKYNKIGCDNNIIDIDIDKKQILYKCEKNHLTNLYYKTYYNRAKSNTVICTECNPTNSNQSGLEIDLYNFISDNYDGTIITNTKSLIKPYEIDIYLPDLRLAFEFNGVFWHNELNKEDNYHQMKTNMCLENDIHLFHVWEDDWVYKKDILKSMILNKLNIIPRRIYARKTEVKILTNNKIVREFLDNNHLQGFVGSSIKIGLFYNDELVSLMTFGKLRKVLNSKSSNGEFEMLRFCNKLNTSVIGGASKLFKYFINNNPPCIITSYADRSHSNGNLYNQLGFIFAHITQPNYYYVIDGIRNHRFNYRKDILVKQGYDKNKSEHDIMLERKIYRIYNSGNYKFIYQSN